MKPTITITDAQKFEEIINRMEATLQKLTDTFERDKVNTRRIDKTDVWTGKSQEALCEKHRELEKNYAPIERSIRIYIKFLKKVLADYIALDQRINSRAEQQSVELDVNS